MIANIEDAERLENSSGRWPVLEFDSLVVYILIILLFLI